MWVVPLGITAIRKRVEAADAAGGLSADGAGGLQPRFVSKKAESIAPQTTAERSSSRFMECVIPE
jgi:hypothetical protein